MSDLNASVWAPQARWTHRGGHMRTPNRRAFMNPVPPESQSGSLKDRDSSNGEHLQTTRTPVASPRSPDTIERYDRLLRRLHWKGQLLFYAHQVASEHSDQNAVLAQFKLDFFEFYTLLERTLVYLLAVFRVQVAKVGPAADRSSSPVKSAVTGSGPGANEASQNGEPKLSLVGSKAGPSNHSYHMNVLQALDQPGPLHNVLGKGTVREYLDFAKDLRNRWKDVGEGGDASRGIPQLDGDGEEDATKQLPTKDELTQLLEKLFEGLHAARPLIEEELQASKAQDQHSEGDDQDIALPVRIHEDMTMELDHDAPYEVVTDDMEIE